MKKYLLIIPIIALMFVGLFKTQIVNAVSPYYPFQGGTGTSTVPTYGQVLVGNSIGTYSLMATSSLGISSGSTFAFPFTINSWGNSTTTTLGFLNGFFSTASSTLSSNLFLTSLSQGGLYIGSSGKVNTVSTSTPTVTAPITYSGTLGQFLSGSSGAFGCTTASAGVTGCLSGTDWSTFNNKGSGSVTSVGFSDAASTLTIGSTPITTSGTITATLNLGHTNTWSILQNFGAASTTQLTASSYLGIPNSSTASTTDAGSIKIDTTDNEFHYYGSSEEVIYPKKTPGFVYATTTAWTATTTIPFPSPFTAQTVNAVQCYTDAGTLNVDVYHTSTHLNGLNTQLNASTTQGVVNFSTSNTMAVGEKWYADVGTPASSPTKISCTFKISVIAD